MAFWRKSQTLTPELLRILARVESGVAETWIGSQRGGYRGLVQISAGNGTAFLEETITDTGPWEIALTFVQNTEDGQLTTRVYSAPDRATVDVTLNTASGVLKLECLDYMAASHPAARRHVREWVLRRALPDLKAAKARFISEKQRKAAELDDMRKKHLS